MAEVPGISSVPEQTPPQQTDPTAGVGGAVGMLPANATLGDLERIAKPLATAIMFAMATNICNASKKSEERKHEARLEAERNRGG